MPSCSQRGQFFPVCAYKNACVNSCRSVDSTCLSRFTKPRTGTRTFPSNRPGRPFGPSELVIVATGVENHHHQLFGFEIEPRFQESVAALERPEHEPAGVFHGLALVLHDEV